MLEKGFTVKLSKEEFLGHRFDIEPTCKSEAYLVEDCIYLGWLIEPMSAKRFLVYAPIESASECSRKLEYVPELAED